MDASSENLQPVPHNPEQEKKSYPRLEAWEMSPDEIRHIYSADEIKEKKGIKTAADYEKQVAEDYKYATWITQPRYREIAKSANYIISMDREGRYFYWALDEALKKRGVEKPVFSLNEKFGDSAKTFLFKHILEKNADIKGLLSEVYDSSNKTSDNDMYRFLSAKYYLQLSPEQLTQTESVIRAGRNNIERFQLFKEMPRGSGKKYLELDNLCNYLSFLELQERGLLKNPDEPITDEELSALSYAHLAGSEVRKVFAGSEILQAGDDSINTKGSFTVCLVDGSYGQGNTLGSTKNMFRALVGDKLSIHWVIPFGQNKRIGENSLDYGNFWSKIVTFDGLKEVRKIESLAQRFCEPIVSSEEHEMIVRKMLR